MFFSNIEKKVMENLFLSISDNVNQKYVLTIRMETLLRRK